LINFPRAVSNPRALGAGIELLERQPEKSHGK
jgi:hypothetical protein